MVCMKQKLSLVPQKPGCYLMKNKDGVIIYVGKAKKLKNRLSSYFRGTHTGKTARLVSEIADFEYMVVGSETEAFILELNLIKKYDPKYNILLRDDKSYPYIELTEEAVPRLLVVRNINRKKNRHTKLYGPYPNVSAARSVVNLLNRMYPLRKCRTFQKKPCLYYHIGQCLGYCTYQVSKDKIDEMVRDIQRFLKGDHTLITEKIKSEMLAESMKMNYEKAQELKELLSYIETTLSKQKVEIQDDVDRDIFGYYEEKGYLSIQCFFVRGGKILERHSHIFPIVDEVGEELTRYIAKFYEKNVLLPKEILVPDQVDTELLESVLGVTVHVPIRGVKKNMVLMACDNAKIAMNEKFELIQKDEERTTLANQELQNILHLDHLDRIELFDNSNLFGSYNVSGMVVFVDGKPSKNDYRKFKITVDQNDDYGTMREVIYRRYFRVLKDGLTRPDLIIVDGGIGQMHVAREVLASLGMNIPVVGLKKDDHHATSKLLAFDPIVEIDINKRSNLFYYLERMQDEVHNYTIHYHKQIRSKGALESVLDHVEGIGEKRKKELLKRYRTTTKLKSLSVDELKEILPEKVAFNLYEFLQAMDEEKK
ncbi:MAG TPA: excinuclease ABC subunit UvrC [Candidatus Fimihabitans intestinipullorum]|uniref:UvrABC system protein C n=1 Tax=Candidatus Fimihabitans intestinipullorum TaxID=2840820 RepID=A0A9D1HUL1_9BACT|nr:excinuclease ABC subunit UvrC [Candidatus Fimihabitans intestinipullorum]